MSVEAKKLQLNPARSPGGLSLGPNPFSIFQDSRPDTPGIHAIVAKQVGRGKSVRRWNKARQSPAINEVVRALPTRAGHQAIFRGGENSLLGAEILALDRQDLSSSGNCQLRSFPPVIHGVVLLLQLPVKVDFHLVVAGGGEVPVHTAWVVGHPVADEDVGVEEEADHAPDLFADAVVAVAKVGGAHALREVSILLTLVGLARIVCKTRGFCQEKKQTQKP